MEETRQVTATTYHSLAKWVHGLMTHLAGDWEDDVDNQNMQGIRAKILDNPNMAKIRPAHTKVKNILKVFKPVDEAADLSSLEDGFGELLPKLDKVLALCLKTVAVHLGCIYLYQKIPAEKKVLPKRELFRELKQLWRDSKAPLPDNVQGISSAGYSIPKKLIEQIAAACEKE